mmetsp:Transcript_12044/g.26367  ORF Transcript_12044/g.26367 Transcript_12044/m.26367 type:complete len:87 (+) Transcript_12044:5-265(+)
MKKFFLQEIKAATVWVGGNTLEQYTNHGSRSQYYMKGYLGQITKIVSPQLECWCSRPELLPCSTLYNAGPLAVQAPEKIANANTNI